MSINSGEITMQLSHPLTEEQWDAIEDVDFEHTNRIWFHTKHGKDVEFAKVVRCKDCVYYLEACKDSIGVCALLNGHILKNDYCSFGEHREVKE